MSPHRLAKPLTLEFCSETTHAPFTQKIVHLTQAEHIELKQNANYWESQYEILKKKYQALQHELDLANAKIKDLNQRLYGKKSEKQLTRADKNPNNNSSTSSRKPRGQQAGSKGHGRTARPNLPIIEEERDVALEDKTCDVCGKEYNALSKTEDSTITEVHVNAHVRRIKRKVYAQACKCEGVPGIVTAIPEPRLFPKCANGISVWTEVLLSKFLFSRATNNLCRDYDYRGLPVSTGTITDGLKRMAPLFEPLIDEFIKKQLTEDLFHNDETGWKVFEAIEGKVGHRWYLWVTQSPSVVYYIMAPTRSGDIPIEYFSGLDKTLEQVIVVCDRYSGYKRLSREIAMIILAFCWAHVRRDFLDAAKSWPVLERWMFSWVDTIGELYAHNKQRLAHWDETLALTDQSADFEQQHQRLEEATAQMKTRCDTELKKETLHTAQRKVLESLNNHWLGLTVFIKSPQVPMDNNTAEQRMRNPGMGRKNYYGSGSQWSAHLAAMMFSIFQTLLLWKINPFHWLHCYLTACAENGGHAPKNSADFIPWLMSEERKQELVKPLPMAKVIDIHQQQIPSQPQPP